MPRPKVSVLMTAFNREKFIGESITSVLKSTLEDFELLVVDDNSKDATVDIARAFARTDNRVKVHVNAENLGDYNNRNRAAAFASGDYLKYVDSDDIIYPYCLQAMLDCMQAFPAAGLGLSRPYSADGAFPICLSPGEAYTEHFLGPGLLNNAPLSAIIKRDLFEAAGGFSGKRYVGDGELWLKLARTCSVVKMPLGLTWWRSHPEQEMAYETASRSVIALRFQLNIQALEHPQCPLSPAHRSKALRRVRRDFALEVLQVARRGHLRDAITMYRATGLATRDVVMGVLRHG